jgi:hypothetical protein
MTWSKGASKWEKEWIHDFKESHKWYQSRYHPYVRTLRYRHICPKRFKLYVSADCRVNAATKKLLQEIVLKKNDRTSDEMRLYEWYVLDVQSFIPEPYHCDISDLLHVVSLPFAKLLFDDYCIESKNNNIFVKKGKKDLVGILTMQGVLWKTRLWSKTFDALFTKICQAYPAKILGYLCPCCPFCGIGIRNAEAHSMNCMTKYASWFSSLFSEWDGKLKRRVFRTKQIKTYK